MQRARIQRPEPVIGKEITEGLITVRIIGSDMIDLTRKGVPGRGRMKGQIIWGAEDILAAHSHAAVRRDQDGIDQARALRWAIQVMGLSRRGGKGRL